MRFLRDNHMGLDRGLEIFIENGTETTFDMTPQRLADFGLLARYTELHGSNYPLRAGFGCPAKDVGTRPCPIKHCTAPSSDRRARRPECRNFTLRAVFPGGVEPKKESASLRGTWQQSGGRCPPRLPAAIRRCARPT